MTGILMKNNEPNNPASTSVNRQQLRLIPVSAGHLPLDYPLKKAALTYIVRLAGFVGVILANAIIFGAFLLASYYPLFALCLAVAVTLLFVYFYGRPNRAKPIHRERLEEYGLTRKQLRLKRAFDVAFAAIVLIYLAPVLCIIVILIKLDSPGPALVAYNRIGQYGRHFKMLKFRTTTTVHEHITGEPSHNLPTHQSKPMLVERVTRVGRWLRRTSLDELPQLINVLRGDMSLVGPRPLPPAYASQMNEQELLRFQLPAGITGKWQVSTRADPGIFSEEDRYYLRNYSLLLDVKILMLTLALVLRGEERQERLTDIMPTPPHLAGGSHA
jgi:lipopolysaccharide/colanic/teichoic acid biosynthesis glycosyltransferase